MSDEECLITTLDSLSRNAELFSERLMKTERALQIALKMLQIWEARKNPEEHPEFQSFRDQLESLKEELKK